MGSVREERAFWVHQIHSTLLNSIGAAILQSRVCEQAVRVGAPDCSGEIQRLQGILAELEATARALTAPRTPERPGRIASEARRLIEAFRASHPGQPFHPGGGTREFAQESYVGDHESFRPARLRGSGCYICPNHSRRACPRHRRWPGLPGLASVPWTTDTSVRPSRANRVESPICGFDCGDSHARCRCGGLAAAESGAAWLGGSLKSCAGPGNCSDRAGWPDGTACIVRVAGRCPPWNSDGLLCHTDHSHCYHDDRSGGATAA